MRGIAIGSQSGQDKVPLLARDERCSIRVVLDKPVRGNSDNDGRQPFQYEDPVPAIDPDDASHMANALPCVSR